MLIPIRDLVSPFLLPPRFEATRRSWNGEQTEHFNWLLLCVWLYFQKSHSPLPPPQSHSVQFENLQFPASAARVHTERERSDAVISAYLHESLARTTRLHSFHPRNGELERTKFVESLITLKEGGNCCCERRGRETVSFENSKRSCF